MMALRKSILIFFRIFYLLILIVCHSHIFANESRINTNISTSYQMNDTHLANNRTKFSLLHGEYNARSNYVLIENSSNLHSKDFNSPYDTQKIAFLFLTRGPMPHEPVWKEFFNWKADENDYSIYIHPPKDYIYPPNSFFFHREVPNRIHASWGSFSIMAAEKLLFKEALKNKSNQWFILLSESCIPLHSFNTMKYALLNGEKKSYVNACWESASLSKVEKHFHQNLTLHANLSRKNFRKSEQWVALLRKHAQIIVDEEIIAEQFKILHIKFPDEHYIPTILAHVHEEKDTTCGSGFTFTNWNIHYNVHAPKPKHPRNYLVHEIKTLLSRLNSSQINRANLPINKGYASGCSGNKFICHFMARKIDSKATRNVISSIETLFIEPNCTYVQSKNTKIE